MVVKKIVIPLYKVGMQLRQFRLNLDL